MASPHARPLDFNRLIAETGQALRVHWGLILAGPIVGIALSFLPLAIYRFLPASPDRVGGLTVLALIMSGVQWLVRTYYQAFVVRFVGAAMLGAPEHWRASLAVTLQRYPRLLAISLIYGLASGLGLLLLAVPGLMVATAWLVAMPVAAVQNAGADQALIRSQDLTRGNRWRILGGLLVYFVALLALSLIARLLNTSLSFGPPTWIIILLISLPSILLTWAVGPVALASLYVELRSLREGIRPNAVAEVFA